MRTLYVIGNGFDLWHELPTSYNNFYQFSARKLDRFETYFLLDSYAETHPWSDFENALGKYDWSLFYDAFNEIDVTDNSFKSSMAYSLEDDVKEATDELVSTIEEEFNYWIESINFNKVTPKTSFNPNGLFLTFNYTSTLQDIYKIYDKKILHIHGSVKNNETLIFGHNKTIESVPELEINGDSNRTIFTDSQNAAKYPFYKFHVTIVGHP